MRGFFSLIEYKTNKKTTAELIDSALKGAPFYKSKNKVDKEMFEELRNYMPEPEFHDIGKAKIFANRN